MLGGMSLDPDEIVGTGLRCQKNLPTILFAAIGAPGRNAVLLAA